MSTNLMPLAVVVTLLNNVVHAAPAKLEPRLENGLALTPPMGWNSYNHYSCLPNEAIIRSNAQALVDLGLDKLGYKYVTTDCGWSTNNRTANGTLTWNSNFPSGFPALGQYIHDRGLKFGVYSDSGIDMCDNGVLRAGSLFYEQTDADTFASWGADFLKYDNCYSDAALGYPDTSYTPSTSPAPRMANMTKAIANTGRKMLFEICEWGIDFPSAWAPELSNMWRITNDIIPAWRTIFRQVNQFVPSASVAGPGQWPDLDMLEVGNNIFTNEEEKTHFTMWAICKSPLTIGCALKDNDTSIANSSLAILSNKHAISYNQDSLGVAANLTRRFSEELYDIWSGPLSRNRTVVALINWADYDQVIDLNLPDLGFQHAKSIYNVWDDSHTSNTKTTYTTTVPMHGTALLEIRGTSPAGTYPASKFASNYGHVSLTVFTNIYGVTTSHSYTLTISFKKNQRQSAQKIIVETSASSKPVTATLPPGSTTITLTIPLSASASNTITIKSASNIDHITISNPSSTFYPATSFALSGGATFTTCPTGLCLPSGSKIGYLTPSGAATLQIATSNTSAPSEEPTTKYLEITYINNDIALATSWGNGRNARNITVQVNNMPAVRLEVPLSGRSSELYSPGGGWYDSATLGVLVPGFGRGTDGVNTVVVSNVDGDEGVTAYGSDFVGLRVWD